MGDSGYGHGKHFMHDINHSRYASYIVWNVDVVMCHCMCILGGE